MATGVCGNYWKARGDGPSNFRVGVVFFFFFFYLTVLSLFVIGHVLFFSPLFLLVLVHGCTQMCIVKLLGNRYISVTVREKELYRQYTL